jgi:hypothetical protein
MLALMRKVGLMTDTDNNATEAAMCTCQQCCYYCADEVNPGWIKQDGCKPPKPCQDCNPDGSYPMQERDEPCSVKNDDVMNERM